MFKQIIEWFRLKKSDIPPVAHSQNLAMAEGWLEDTKDERLKDMSWGEWKKTKAHWKGKTKYQVVKWIKDSAKKRGQKMTWGMAKQVYWSLIDEELWVNNKYQVSIRKETFHDEVLLTGMWHLSIKLLSKDVIHDWRDLQRIKNELCDPNAEAVEIYPAEARLVDTANQFHLWVLMEKDEKGNHPVMPFGYMAKRTVDFSTVRDDGSKQRGKDV